MFLMQSAVSTCSARMTFSFAAARVAEQSGLVHAALREINRAGAGGGIARATHRLASFFGGVDVRDQNAVGAHIERLLNAAAIVISGHAHHGLRAAAGDSGQHGRQLWKAHGPVLCIDQQPVVAAVRQLFGDGGTVRIQEQAELGLSFAQLFLKLSSTEYFTHSFDVSWVPGGL